MTRNCALSVAQEQQGLHTPIIPTFDCQFEARALPPTKQAAARLHSLLPLRERNSNSGFPRKIKITSNQNQIGAPRAQLSR